MVDSKTIQHRLPICQACPFWRNRCLKGHALLGSAGCPLRKFEPVEAAGYAHDKDVDLTPAGGTGPGCCGDGPAELKPLSWPQALAHLTTSVKEWRAKGYPITESAVYAARTGKCKACPGQHYAWFQCRLCKCVVYSKAMLATETCPAGYW